MKNIYFFLIALLYGNAACSDFLEEYSQNLSYVNDIVDLEELMLGGAYWTKSKGDADFGLFFLNAMDDDIAPVTISHNYNSPGYNLRRFFTWQEYPFNSPDEKDKIWGNDKSWEKFYKKIAVCNSILVDIERFKDEPEYRKIKGETLLLRAFYYFHLTNIWGEPYDRETAENSPGVPVKISSEIEDLDYVRSSVAECYRQILSDADEALNLLQGVYPSSTKRLGEQAARAFLARVHLYMGNYEETVAQCNAIIKSPHGLALTDLSSISVNDYKDAITKGRSPEIIFTAAIGISWRGSSGYRFTPSADLLSCYREEGDLRFRLNAQSHFFSYRSAKNRKFYTRWLMDGNWEWIGFGFSYPEVFLNKAEAEAMSGHDAEAAAALDELRSRRIVGAEPAGRLTGRQLVDFIREERRRELCFSYQRWYDLRRYAVAPLYPEAVSVTHVWEAEDSDLENGTYLLRPYPEDKGWILPIPTYVLEDNHGSLTDIPRPSRNPEPDLH